ncbi:MAG: MASE1 domain-containing protein [Spirochaetales bacterium]|nr:MASE1 domain-containing protein [Spirochaetales bacterium]
MNNKKNPVFDNLIFAFLYWGISHLNWLLFSRVGILPMPIWPAAGLAFVGAFYRGWKIAPGIALGTFLSNYISLGAPLLYALLIPVMNTLGPLVGAALARRKVSLELNLIHIEDVLVIFISGILIVPLLTATGGIGFKWMLGLLPAEVLVTSWLKWFVAHLSGTLLIGIPLFAWVRVGRQR